MKKEKLHYAWIIMYACISMKIGEGVIKCMLGNFITPIVAELGCKVSELTLTTSIDAVGCACFYLIAAKLITEKKAGIVMGIASTLQVLALALMGSYHSVYLFYISGLVIGSASAFTGLVATPVLINMWFRKKAGTVLGTVIAVSSASSVVMNYLTATFIDKFGWRNAYLILAVIAFIFMVPATFGFMRTPREKGCEPYGAEADDAPSGALQPSSEWGLTKKEAFKQPALWISWAAMISISLACGCSGYFANYATMELGQSIYFGSITAILFSLGCVACSMIIGRLDDKYGVRSGFIWGVGFSVLGFGLMLISGTAPVLAIPSALLAGLGGSLYGVQCPLLAKSVVGPKYYSSIWSIMMVANSLIGGGLYFIWGAIYDSTQSYKGAFVLVIAFYVLSLVLGFIALSSAKKYRTGKN